MNRRELISWDIDNLKAKKLDQTYHREITTPTNMIIVMTISFFEKDVCVCIHVHSDLHLIPFP